eukprot:RCo038884
MIGAGSPKSLLEFPVRTTSAPKVRPPPVHPLQEDGLLQLYANVLRPCGLSGRPLPLPVSIAESVVFVDNHVAGWYRWDAAAKAVVFRSTFPDKIRTRLNAEGEPEEDWDWDGTEDELDEGMGAMPPDTDASSDLGIDLPSSLTDAMDEEHSEGEPVSSSSSSDEIDEDEDEEEAILRRERRVRHRSFAQEDE